MKLSYFCIAFAFSIINISSCKKYFPVFRNDYTYLEEFDAYYKEHNIGSSWSDAVEICKAEGAELFVPESKIEIDTIFNLAYNEYKHVWIGVHDIYAEGFFVSTDGRYFLNFYTNWDSEQPNNYDNQNCVLMNNEGKYNDYKCDTKASFFCKKHRLPQTYKDPKETALIDQYSFFASTQSFYKFHKTPKTWHDAVRTCIAEESHLAIINSEEEADSFVDALSSYTGNSINENCAKCSIHLGFSDLIKNGTYLTVNGKDVYDSGYIEWDENQPDNDQGEEHCGSMTKYGKLNDVNCNKRSMFICEKN